MRNTGVYPGVFLSAEKRVSRITPCGQSLCDGIEIFFHVDTKIVHLSQFQAKLCTKFECFHKIYILVQFYRFKCIFNSIKHNCIKFINIIYILDIIVHNNVFTKLKKNRKQKSYTINIILIFFLSNFRESLSICHR